jgi:hypothetical protein
VNLVAILVGTAAVIAFDTIGSLASQHFRFPYSRLAFGSSAIYFMVGFGTAAGESVAPAALSGAIVALFDSTLGWAISWRIGSGRPNDQPLTDSRIIMTAIFVMMLGAFFGALGGELRLYLFLQAG